MAPEAPFFVFDSSEGAWQSGVSVLRSLSHLRVGNYFPPFAPGASPGVFPGATPGAEDGAGG